MSELLGEIAASLRPGTLVVSLAAGVDTASIEAGLGGETPVVRVMPNTPALVDQGMAAISPGSHAAARAPGPRHARSCRPPVGW